MAILIKNRAAEARARELAALTGESLTTAVDTAVQTRLAVERAKRRPQRTLADLQAATERFRQAVGLDQRKVGATRADFDALWDLPGFPKDED